MSAVPAFVRNSGAPRGLTPAEIKLVESASAKPTA